VQRETKLMACPFESQQFPVPPAQTSIIIGERAAEALRNEHGLETSSVSRYE
jgi:hypothetical protein